MLWTVNQSVKITPGSYLFGSIRPNVSLLFHSFCRAFEGAQIFINKCKKAGMLVEALSLSSLCFLSFRVLVSILPSDVELCVVDFALSASEAKSATHLRNSVR